MKLRTDIGREFADVASPIITVLVTFLAFQELKGISNVYLETSIG
jgi:hypothetical protein